jgi:thioredoxin-related protein
MKKRLLILAVLAVTGLTGIRAQEKVKWYSIEEALQLNSKEPRMMVIDVYTDWCGWCKRMDAGTFSDPEVATILNRDFYPVKLNAEGKEDIVIGERTFKFVNNGGSGYHELAAVITRGRLSYPTISYVDEQGRIISVEPGYKGPDEFRIYLAYYNGNAYKTQAFDDFRASYISRL